MARVQEDSNFFDEAANMDQAFGSNVTAGNLLVVLVNKLNVTGSSDPFLLADVSKLSGTATIGTIQMDVDREFLYDGGSNYIAVAVYSALVTGTGSLTMRSVLGSSQYGNISVVEYDGEWDASRVEDTAEDDDTNSGVNPPTTGDMTSAGAALFVGALADVSTGGNDHVEDGAWSLIYEQNSTDHMVGSFIDRIVGSTTTDAASWTAPANDNPWVAVGVVYKEAAAEGEYTLTADYGSYSVSGSEAYRDISMAAEQGAYALTGQDIVTNSGFTLIAELGSYTIQGQDGFIDLSMTAAGGAYALTGRDVILNKTFLMPADGAAYVVTGQAAGLTWSNAPTGVVIVAAGRSSHRGVRSRTWMRRG